MKVEGECVRIRGSERERERGGVSLEIQGSEYKDFMVWAFMR